MYIEQDRQGKPENPIAKKIGKTLGTIGVIFEELRAFSPFATTVFTVSETFGISTRTVIKEATTKSTLPENIHIAHPNDKYSQGQFVEISIHPSVPEVENALERGALKHITMDYNVDKLAQKLSE